VEQNIAILQESMARGLTQPSVVADRIIDQLQRQASQGADQSALLEPVRHFPSTIPAAEQARHPGAPRETYEQQFVRPLHSLHDFIAGTYRAKQRAKVGIGSLANGRALYATLIHRLTTTTRTPEEIHQLGLSELQRLEGLMEGVAHETGFTGDLAAFGRY